MGFFNNMYVNNITIGPNVRYHNGSMYNAFSQCYNFNQPVNIPDDVVNMSKTFYLCNNFNQSVNIPNGVTNMDYAFYGCNKFNRPINIPNSVTNMCSTFYGCNSLNVPIRIPDSVTNVYQAFKNISVNGKDIYIGNGVTNLSGAMQYVGSKFCPGNLIIGTGVTNGYNAITNYVKIKNIVILSKNITNMVNFIGNRGWSNTVANRLNIYVPIYSNTYYNLNYNSTNYQNSLIGTGLGSSAWAGSPVNGSYVYCTSKNVYIYFYNNYSDLPFNIT